MYWPCEISFSESLGNWNTELSHKRSVRTVLVLGFALEVLGVGFLSVIQIRWSLPQSITKFSNLHLFRVCILLVKVFLFEVDGCFAFKRPLQKKAGNQDVRGSSLRIVVRGFRFYY